MHVNLQKYIDYLACGIALYKKHTLFKTFTINAFIFFSSYFWVKPKVSKRSRQADAIRCFKGQTFTSYGRLSC